MYCQHDVICRQDANILVVNSFRHPIPISGTGIRVDRPGFQTKSLRLLVVMILESFHAKLLPVWHTCLAKADLELFELETAFVFTRAN